MNPSNEFLRSTLDADLNMDSIALFLSPEKSQINVYLAYSQDTCGVHSTMHCLLAGSPLGSATTTI